MSIAIFLTTVLLMILSLIFFPKIKVYKYELNSHWIIVLIGSIIALLIGKMNYQNLISSIFSQNEMNPVKLITLFISMTMLSIYLNEIGVFEKLAFYLLSKVKTNQFIIFTVFSIMVAVLTIFVSNDVIILTLTPLSIYFAKNAKINPLPYVFSVLVFANTFSMILMIGNPTNIYLSLNQNITFLNYFKVMIIPSIFIGMVSFFMLALVFRKELKKELTHTVNQTKNISKPELIIGLSHMLFCLILLIFSNLIELPMWLITFITALSLLIISTIYYTKTKKDKTPLLHTIKKAPWSFLPLILGMYVLVEALKQQNIHLHLLEILNQYPTIYSFGITSFISSNLMNNLPMSMFYALIIENLEQGLILKATYSTIIGANLGVLLTPMGALAGLMWFDLVKKENIKINIKIYVKKLFILAILSLFIGLIILDMIL